MANTKECYKNYLRLKTPALIRILRRNEISVFSWNNPLYASDERSFCSSKKIMKVSEKTRGLQNFFSQLLQQNLDVGFGFHIGTGDEHVNLTPFSQWRMTCLNFTERAPYFCSLAGGIVFSRSLVLTFS